MHGGHIPMGLRSDEFGDCVRECGMRVDVEYWIRIFAVVHATGGEDDRDEVDACVFEKWCGA